MALKSEGFVPLTVSLLITSEVKPTLVTVIVFVVMLLTVCVPKPNGSGLKCGSGSITLACNATCCVVLPLVTLSVAVEIPTPDESCG